MRPAPALNLLAAIRHNTMRQLKNTFRLLTLATFIAFPTASWSQQPSTYNLDLVRSVQFTSDNQNHILTILQVTPKIKDFKMVLSMKVTYEIGQGKKVIDLQKQKENNIRVTIYGRDLAQKNQKLYDLVKDSLNLNTDEDIRLIVFDFSNLTKTAVDNMTMIYGL